MFANKLGDLDDFIAPSVECIAPLFPKNNAATQKNNDQQLANPFETDIDMPQVTTNSK